MAFGISQLENRSWTFKNDVTVNGDFTVAGDFTFGDAAADTAAIAGDLRVNDDRFLHFGTDEDVSIEYDEDGGNVLTVTGADWLFSTTVGITFRDSALKINSSADGQLDIDADGKVSINGKIEPITAGGAASASGLLLGVGTSGSPATTATADAKFVELRCQSTATSGDNRLLYMRYDLNGVGGGECLRAFTKITAAGVGTARGSHISLDMGNTTGTITGLGVGVDAQLLMGNTAYSAGTWAALNSEIYSDGASTDVSGLGAISFLRCVAGGDATGAANVDDNAYFVEFSGVAEGSGNLIDTDKTTHTAVGGIRIKTNAGDRWIAVVSN